jgi:pyruvate dehydrogenase E1 component beta subunit
MWEYVGHYGGAFAVSKGLHQEFGEKCIMDVPLSESGVVGAGVGAAIVDIKPNYLSDNRKIQLLDMNLIFYNALLCFKCQESN